MKNSIQKRMPNSRGVHSIIFRKLNQETGASLSVALLFFLVCALIATMTIASAYAAVGRITDLQVATQNNYTVLSAAEVIAEQIRAQKDIEIVESYEITDEDVDPIKGETLFYLNDGENLTQINDSSNHSIIVKQLKEVYDGEGVGSSSEKLTINVPAKSDMSDLNITMTTDSTNAIEVVISQKNPSVGSEDKAAVFYVRCAPSMTTESSTSTTEVGEIDNKAITKTVQTVTTKISYKSVYISKV